MKTKLGLLFVVAFATCQLQLAYGQAPTHQVPRAATVAPAGTTFTILVPVQGPPVQYEMVGATAPTIAHTHYPSSYWRNYYGGSYGYGGGYGGRYRSSYYYNYGRGPRIIYTERGPRLLANHHMDPAKYRQMPRGEWRLRSNRGRR